MRPKPLVALLALLTLAFAAGLSPSRSVQAATCSATSTADNCAGRLRGLLADL